MYCSPVDASVGVEVVYHFAPTGLLLVFFSCQQGEHIPIPMDKQPPVVAFPTKSSPIFEKYFGG
jgi:hypothetical protein